MPCRFKVGDRVIFTNDYGLKFPHVVRGFAKSPHPGNRFVYIFSDAWWFPVSPDRLERVDVCSENCGNESAYGKTAAAAKRQWNRANERPKVSP